MNTNYLAYAINGYMYEKYNAFEVGVGGGGGTEHIVEACVFV